MHTPTSNKLTNVEKLFKKYEDAPAEVQAAVIDAVRHLLDDLKTPIRTKATSCLEAKETEASASVGTAKVFAPRAGERDNPWKTLPHYKIILRKNPDSLIITLSNKEERDRFLSVLQDIWDEKKEESDGVAPFEKPEEQDNNSIIVTGDESQTNSCITTIQKFKQHEIILEAGFEETSLAI